MEPIDSWNDCKNTRTLKITDGPNLHKIAACSFPADMDHFLHGVSFVVCLPYKENHAVCVQEVPIPILLIEHRMFDVGERMALGGYLRGEGFVSVFTPRKKAPFQITNYSVKTRTGFMEVDYVGYMMLFDFVKKQM